MEAVDRLPRVRRGLEHFVLYIPLRIEPEWSGTIRPCLLERAEFERKFIFVSEALP